MYSPVIDIITFRFLISLAVSERLDICIMNVVTTYWCMSLNMDIYMKIPEWLKMHEAYKSKNRKLCSIKLQRSLYRLKQSKRMRYNSLSDYLIKEWYINYHICPCVFIRKYESGFAIVAVYVDDIWLNSWRASENYWISEKRIWDERLRKNKILSRLADRVYN